MFGKVTLQKIDEPRSRLNNNNYFQRIYRQVGDSNRNLSVKPGEITEQHTSKPANITTIETLTCHHCNKLGHIRPFRPELGKSDVNCYKCGKKGHFPRDCTAKINQVNNIEVQQQGTNEYLRQATDLDNQGNGLCNLNTLLNTGSPVSFVELNYLPSEMMNVVDENACR